MQVGLREILERKHLVEFASRSCIIDVYVNLSGLTFEAPKFRQPFLKVVSTCADDYPYPSRKRLALQNLQEVVAIERKALDSGHRRIWSGQVLHQSDAQAADQVAGANAPDPVSRSRLSREAYPLGVASRRFRRHAQWRLPQRMAPPETTGCRVLTVDQPVERRPCLAGPFQSDHSSRSTINEPVLATTYSVPHAPRCG